MADLAALRVAEARSYAVATACARAHQHFARAVAEYAAPEDSDAFTRLQEARRDALLTAVAAYQLVVRASLEHDLDAARLAVAELESRDRTTFDDERLERRRVELAEAELRLSNDARHAAE